MMLCLLNAFNDILVKSFVPDRSVVTLDICVLLGLAELDSCILISRFEAHASSLPLIYSGPLSTRMVSGLPRHSVIWFKLRITRAAASEKSTSMPRPSRLKSTLIGLIEHRMLPARLVGKHRRLPLADVLAYRADHFANRSKALDDLAVYDQELGLE